MPGLAKEARSTGNTRQQVHAMPAQKPPLLSPYDHKDTQSVKGRTMEIALIVILFLIGSVGGAMQALKYVERRRKSQNLDKPSDVPSSQEK